MRRLIDNSNDPPKKQPHIGRYGHLRKAYLESYRPDLWLALMASETLYEHCAEIEAAAKSRMNIILPKLMEYYGVTEKLKAENQLEWIRQMNACVAQAEETIKAELIYC